MLVLFCCLFAIRHLVYRQHVGSTFRPWLLSHRAEHNKDRSLLVCTWRPPLLCQSAHVTNQVKYANSREYDRLTVGREVLVEDDLVAICGKKTTYEGNIVRPRRRLPTVMANMFVV